MALGRERAGPKARLTGQLRKDSESEPGGDSRACEVELGAGMTDGWRGGPGGGESVGAHCRPAGREGEGVEERRGARGSGREGRGADTDCEACSAITATLINVTVLLVS